MRICIGSGGQFGAEFVYGQYRLTKFKEITINLGLGVLVLLKSMNLLVEVAAMWSKLYVDDSRMDMLQADSELHHLAARWSR